MKLLQSSGRYLLTLLLLVSLSSCGKEENAPIRTPEQNLVAGWRLTQYLRNGVDETSQLVIKNYEESYANPSAYSRAYLDETNQQKSETGTWKLEDDKKRINISSVSSVKVTRNSGSVSSSYYDIQKLDGQAFWYSFVNGSDRHEFRFSRK